MAYMTVQITDHTKGPFSLSSLFATPSQTGVTVTPTAPAKPPRIAAQCIVQADPANSTSLIYVGTDASMLPTSGGGVGASLGATTPPLVLTDVPLNGVFIAASADNIKVNIIAQGGFQ